MRRNIILLLIALFGFFCVSAVCAESSKRTEIDSHWTLASDNDSCNVAVSYVGKQTLMFMVSKTGIFVLIEDPNITGNDDGVYEAHLSFDKFPDSNGVMTVKNNVMILPKIPLELVRDFMLSEYFILESGDVNEKFELKGSGHAIESVLMCAKKKNIAPSFSSESKEKNPHPEELSI